ncbi:hypothetical protein ACIP6T_23650 [Pantoea sp. NPDC088449]|uniref:Uncharacterized protein n=1 Tax=Candidatus Pantoea floridensis TaxID=1938870 RepID=A0A286DRG7_9GAMM|nr:hypothetical protein [Pantoea floridensis]PIF07476.1 hypothetical protein BX596_4986 [Enterobacteriaceae bacterium JKS000233]SOD61268.1 hypothetical protein SAMN06273570_5057 [Pantoea floridensis]
MLDYYYNENQLIIGEAAIHLALNNADITVDTLVRELAGMAAAEENPARCVQIREAKRWVRGFMPASGNRDELRWVTGAGRGSTH